MTKHIILQKDYTKNPNGFQLKLPLNLECIIPENDSVRLLSQFVEEMDLTDLYSTYERIPENTLPRRMLKIVLYSYMNGDFSSRSMQRNCQRDINFMYLLEGAKAPDHNTIARFRSERLKDIIENLFNQVVLLLKDYGELSCENLFVDGTKIEANANKYTFVWKKAILKHQAKLQDKMHKELPDLLDKYGFKMYLAEDIKAKRLKKFKENLKVIHILGRK